MLNKYPSSELKGVTTQDGTNSFLKGNLQIVMSSRQNLRKIEIFKPKFTLETWRNLENLEANKNEDLYNEKNQLYAAFYRVIRCSN